MSWRSQISGRFTRQQAAGACAAAASRREIVPAGALWAEPRRSWRRHSRQQVLCSLLRPFFKEQPGKAVPVAAPSAFPVPSPLLCAQTAASYRNAAACLVQAVQGALQVSCCPGNATGAGHVQQFSYCKHKKNAPKISLEARQGKGCPARQKESPGAKDSS